MLVCLLPLVLPDPTPLASRIREVVLYPGSALVRRTAELPGSGSFVIEGLPDALDPANVRVRSRGGQVESVEVRARAAVAVPDARVQELRGRLEALRRETRVLEDERAVLEAMRKHLESLMEIPAEKPSVETWRASWEFASARLQENVAAAREVAWKLEAKARELEEAGAELGRSTAAGPARVHDVLVDVLAEGGASIEVEYLVDRAGWSPAYDLRAAADLRAVELTYRARVHQETGEDWDDVELVLSTAQPQRGAQGPEPRPIWLDLARAETHERRASSEAVGAARDDLFVGKAVHTPPATVEDQGLSVQFRLTRRESVESREHPTTVLVGGSSLAIAAERHCAPALDPTVWLRARATNTTPWTLLPGTAAVFFGADSLGNAQIGAVQPGQELTLHLGRDPGITCERTRIRDLAKGPGFLSSTSRRLEAWRTRFENHGTVGASPDGSVEVIVRDVLPRPRDSRIEVEVVKTEPKPSSDERWKLDREERGIVTWVLRVPPGEKGADVVFETEIRYPEGERLARN